MRHNTNYVAIIGWVTASLIVLVCINTRLFSWGLFNIFTDTQFSNEGLKKVENFNPDEDILYLPPLKDKDIFQAAGDLSICRKKSVRKYIYQYLTFGREYLIRSIERSYLHEDAIKEIFNKNKDMHAELSLLPLLESSFEVNAVSVSGAVGLWQFVDNTARPLGLKRDRWLDERRNIEKSTEAALRHLRNLRRLFPSWELTLAAYNAGAGYIKRTMDRTGAKDFWTLADNGVLRDETSGYVPRYIALLVIYKNQRLFGIRDEIKIPEKMKTGQFFLKKPVDLREVSRLSGVPLQTIQELNPELNLPVTPPFLKKYRLRIPIEAEKKLEENAKELYKNAIADVIEYRIKKGDTIAKIARIHNKKTDLIIRLNRLKNPYVLYEGQTIYVPL